jgi:hypothetical protein
MGATSEASTPHCRSVRLSTHMRAVSNPRATLPMSKAETISVAVSVMRHFAPKLRLCLGFSMRAASSSAKKAFS